MCRCNATDSTLPTIRALYDLKSGSNDTIYEHYTTTTTVNRSRSTGTTGSTSRRHCGYKEEQKRGRLRENCVAMIEVGKNPFIRLSGQEPGRGSIVLRKARGCSLYGSQDTGCGAPSLRGYGKKEPRAAWANQQSRIYGTGVIGPTYGLIAHGSKGPNYRSPELGAKKGYNNKGICR